MHRNHKGRQISGGKPPFCIALQVGCAALSSANRLPQCQENFASGNSCSRYILHIFSSFSFSEALNGTEDIDNQPDANNYQYDKIGNLVLDAKKGIGKITWTVYGKIRSIAKMDGIIINYAYDPAGNRIRKTVSVPVNNEIVHTWYVRDAQGNVLAVYSDHHENQWGSWWKEQHLYGSSRLGMWKPEIDVANVDGTSEWLVEGKKRYELSNHLGNVMVVVSDKKIGVTLDPNSSLIEYYEPEIIAAQDYYPFGMLMPGRKFGMGGIDTHSTGKKTIKKLKGSKIMG
jgi:hypothetical protein